MMKKSYLPIAMLLSIVLCLTLLTACGADAKESGEKEESEVTEKTETISPEETPEEKPAETTEETEPTLEDLLGEDYVNYLTETITMQMSNRMEKDPQVRYFPIEDNAPLSDYVTIDETTEFEVDEEGNPVILFPAGTVTDEANGEQSFRIPKLYQ